MHTNGEKCLHSTLSHVYENTPCPEKSVYSIYDISLTNLNIFSYFLAKGVMNIHFIKLLRYFLFVLSSHYIQLT